MKTYTATKFQIDPYNYPDSVKIVSKLVPKDEDPDEYGELVDLK